MTIFKWVSLHPLHLMFCSRLPGLKEKMPNSSIIHIAGTCGKTAASRVLQCRHHNGTKCFWVSLLIVDKNLIYPKFWLTLSVPLPEIIWQRAGILALCKHNHICFMSTLLKQLNSGLAGLWQLLGLPAILPIGPITSMVPECLQCWSKGLQTTINSDKCSWGNCEEEEQVIKA